VRRETYDEDLGQSSWITLAEAREWFRLLRLDAGSRVLEVGCGTGGVTRRLAMETGASAVGVDINPHGIEAASAAAAREAVASRVSFQVVDAERGCRLTAPRSTRSSATTRSIIYPAARSCSSTGTAC
jgi:cyclopropane fatty-acyl-phospholipid synthase-like methyltransferase